MKYCLSHWYSNQYLRALTANTWSPSPRFRFMPLRKSLTHQDTSCFLNLVWTQFTVGTHCLSVSQWNGKVPRKAGQVQLDKEAVLPGVRPRICTERSALSRGMLSEGGVSPVLHCHHPQFTCMSKCMHFFFFLLHSSSSVFQCKLPHRRAAFRETAAAVSSSLCSSYTGTKGKVLLGLLANAASLFWVWTYVLEDDHSSSVSLAKSFVPEKNELSEEPDP